MSRSRKIIRSIILIISLMSITEGLLGQTVTHTRCLYNPLILVPEAVFPDLADLGEGYRFYFDVSNGTVTNISDYGVNPLLPYFTDLNGELLEIDVTIPTQRVRITIYVEDGNGGYSVIYNIDPANNLCDLNLSASSAGAYCGDESVIARVSRSYEIGENGIYDYGEYTNHEWRIQYTEDDGTDANKIITHKNATLAADVSQFRLSMSYDYWADGVSFTPEFNVEYNISVCYKGYVGESPKCESSSGYTFYPDPPELTDYSVPLLTCIGDDAEVNLSFSSSEDTGDNDVRYQYTLVKFTENTCNAANSGKHTRTEGVDSPIVYCKEGASIYNAESYGGSSFTLNKSSFLNTEDETEISFGAGAYQLKIETQYSADGGVTYTQTCTFYDPIFYVDNPGYTSITEIELDDLTLTPGAPSCLGNNDGTLKVEIPDEFGEDGDVSWKVTQSTTSGLLSEGAVFSGLSAGGYSISLEDACEGPHIVTVEVDDIGKEIDDGPLFVPQLSDFIGTDCATNGSVTVSTDYDKDGAEVPVYKIGSTGTYQTGGEYVEEIGVGNQTIYMKLDDKCEFKVDKEFGSIKKTTIGSAEGEISECTDGMGYIEFSGVEKDGGTDLTLNVKYEIKDSNDDIVDTGYITSYSTTDSNELTSGTYSVVFTDECEGDPVSEKTGIEVLGRPAMSVSSVATQIRCVEGKGSCVVTINNGNSGFDISIKKDGSVDDISGYPKTNESGNVFSVSDLDPGIYDISVTENCTGNPVRTDEFTINAAPSAVTLASIGQTNEILCFGDDKGEITVVVQNGTPLVDEDENYIVKLIKSDDSDVIDYKIGTNKSTFIFSELVPDTYYVSLTDGNECHFTFPLQFVEILEPGHLIIDAVSTTHFTDVVTYDNGGVSQLYARCHEEGLISFNPTRTGGTGPYTYTLTEVLSSEDEVNFNNSSDIKLGVSYSLDVTDDNQCDAAAITFEVQNPEKSLSYSRIDDNVTYPHGASVQCSGDTDIGQISVAADGGVGPYDFYIDNDNKIDNVASQTFTGLDIASTGSEEYTVWVTDALGCIYNDDITLTLPEPVTIDDIEFETLHGDVQIACFGETAAVTIEFSGGSDPSDADHTDAGAYKVIIDKDTEDHYYSYPLTRFTNLGVLNIPLPAGDYSVVVSDATTPVVSGVYCESAERTFTLNEPSAELTLPTEIEVTLPNCILDVGGDNDKGNFSLTGTTGGTLSSVFSYTFMLIDAMDDTLQYQTSDDGSVVFNGVALNEGDPYIDKTYTIAVEDINGCTASQPVTMLADTTPLTVTITEKIVASCHDGTNGVIEFTLKDATPDIDGNYKYILSGANLPEPVTITHDALTLSLGTLRDTKVQGEYNIYVVDEYGCDAVKENEIKSIELIAPDSLELVLFKTIRPSFEGMSDGLFAVHADGGLGSYEYSLDGENFEPSILTPENYWLVSDTLAAEYTVYLRDSEYEGGEQHEFCQREVTLTVPQGRIISLEDTKSIDISCLGADDGIIEPILTLENGDSGETIDFGNLTLDWVTSDGDGAGSADMEVNRIVPLENLSGKTYELGAIYEFSSSYDFADDFTYIYNQDTSKTISSSLIKIDEPDALELIFSIYPTTCGLTTDGSINISSIGGWSTTKKHYSLDGGSWIEFSGKKNIKNIDVGPHDISIGLSDGSCTSDYTFEIEEGGLSVAIDTIVHPKSHGANDGYVILSVTTTDEVAFHKIGDASYDSPSGLYSALSAGTYELYVEKTDTSSCSSETIEITLTEPDALSIDLTILNADCSQANGSASALVTGGVSPYTYRWENTNGAVDNDKLSAGEYTFYVTDDNLIEVSKEFEILDNPGIEIINTDSYPADCTYPNGSATFTISGGISPYIVQEVTYANAEITLTDLYAGDTVIYVTDSRGCTTQDTLSIPSQNTLDVAFERSLETTCETANGEIEVTVTGGTAPYVYNWASHAEEDTNTLSGLYPGDYTVTVTDAHGCQASFDTAVVASNGIQAVVFDRTSPYCNIDDGTITITSITGTFAPFEIYLETETDTTLLATHDNSSTTLLEGFGAGDHVLGVYDTNDCRFGVNVALSDDPNRLPTYRWEVTQASACEQATGSLKVENETGTGPFTYAWYDGEGNDLNITKDEATNLSAGTYTAIGTDGAGCPVEVAAILEDMEAPIVQLISRRTSPIGASNGTITIAVSAGGGAPYQYVLEEAVNTTGYFANLSPDTYSLSGKDQYGCASDTLTVSVIGTEQLSIIAVGNTAATCIAAADGSGEVQGTGGIAPYQYYISNTELESSFENLSTGTYWVILMDAIGSQDSVEIEIPVLEQLEVVPYASLVSCENYCDGTIALAITGGSSNYTVRWEDGIEGSERTGLCPGTYNYEIADQSNASCTLSNSITIEEEPYLELYLASVTPPTCYDGSDGVLEVSSSGGSGSYVYDWTSGNTTDTEIGNHGNYTVTVQDTFLDCTVDSVFAIPNQEQITVESKIKQPNCYGSATGSITLTVGHAPSALVLWDNGQIGFTANNLTAGTYGYELQSTLGCEYRGAITVTEREQLAATTTAIDNPCYNYCQGEIALTITGGVTPYSVKWAHGTSSLNPTGLCAGSYTYTVTDGLGCTTQGTQTISQPEQLEITHSEITEVSCSGGASGAIDLTITGGTGNYSYVWSNTATSQDLAALTAGEYTVRITDENSCAIRAATYKITEPNSLAVLGVTGINPSCTGYADGTLAITPFGGTAPYTVSWDNDKSGTAIEGLTAGQYTATITDANGCTLNRTWRLTDPTGMQFGNVVFNDPICHDDSNGNISFLVVGGSGNYAYDWSNTEGDDTIDNLASGDYTVIASDEEDCDITRSFTLDNPEIPTLLGIDEYYVLCVGGELYLEPAIDWSTYVWQGADSYYSEEKTITITEEGTYELTTTDEEGCPSTVETYVEVSENPLDPDFILISEAITYESIIFIDLSIPIPDRLNWILPENDAIVINEQSEASIELVFTEAGTYEIGMELGLSNCVAEIYKTITVTEAVAGRQLNQEMVNDNKVAVRIWPNPTSDEIQLIFNAADESPLEVELIGAGQRSFRTTLLEGKKDYLIKWSLADAPSGVYFLIFRQGDQVESKRIVILK